MEAILDPLSKIVHSGATLLFLGAASYVNIVETPARYVVYVVHLILTSPNWLTNIYSRKSLKDADAVIDNFQASFPRAKVVMAPLALVGSLSGLFGKQIPWWWLQLLNFQLYQDIILISQMTRISSSAPPWVCCSCFPGPCWPSTPPTRSWWTGRRPGGRERPGCGRW